METKSFKMNWLFVLAVALMTISVNAWGDITLTDKAVTLNSFSSFSGDGYKTVDNYTISDYSGFSVVNCMLSSSQLQLKASSGSLTSPTIKSPAGFDIAITYTSDANLTVQIGTETAVTSGSVLQASTTSTSTTFTISAGNKYGKISQIVLTPKAGCDGTQLTTPEVTATPGNASATLTWTAVPNASSYQVSWNGGAYATATSPYEKSGLTNGTEYTWKVKAIGNGTTYCDSEEASGTVTPTAVVNYTVTWKVNGETYTAGSPTTQVASGQKVTTLPTAPSVICGDKFMGWTDHEMPSGTTAPSTLFTTAAASPTINATTTFYAVFADEEK